MTPKAYEIPDGQRSRPRAWIVCPYLGRGSEPWLWRQVVGIRRFDRTVLTAKQENKRDYPTPNVTVVEDERVPPQEQGLARWLRRANRGAHGNYFALDRRSSARLARLAEVEPPDVLLCHFGHLAVRFVPLARRLGVPIVAHFHGMDLSSSLRNRWYRWSLERTLPELAAAVVVGSHQQQLLASKGFPAERLHLIPCGVPVDDFPSPRSDRTNDPIRFITVCRLVPWKGVDISIRALAELHSRGVDAELHVLGDGPERLALENLTTQLNLTDWVVFHGPLPQGEVHKQLTQTDVFLQHSREYNGWVEGFGVSITEAAATGLPVVVSDCGGIVDQVEDGVTGFVVPQGDVLAMAERMLALALDPDLRRALGRAGRRQARERFNTADQIESLEQVLLEAIHQRRLT